MLHVDELHFSTVRGGMADGFPVVHVELGKDRAVGVGTLVKSITSFAKSVLVKICGDIHNNGNDELYALVSTLQEQGYGVIAEVRGNEKRPWADKVLYKIALIDEEPWLMFACNEIRYSPSHGGEIPYPNLLGIHINAYCYLIPHRDCAGGDIFDFLRSHPGFRVLSGKTYRQSIPLAEDV